MLSYAAAVAAAAVFAIVRQSLQKLSNLPFANAAQVSNVNNNA